MHAVILTGGKQHKVTEGEVLKVEKLNNEVGETVSIDKVLLIADGENVKIGEPYLQGATIDVEVVSHGRHKKIEIIKFKRRKHHMKHQGHRQYYTEIKINKINVA